jgi:hypothetical protein
MTGILSVGTFISVGRKHRRGPWPEFIARRDPGADRIDPPRLLIAADVAEAARFFYGTSFTSLAEHCDPAELTSGAVYPGI